MRQISRRQLDALLSDAKSNPRKRLNLNIHPELNDPFQRFFNVMHPGTYVRPHRHEGDNRWELFVIVQGEALVLEFDDQGRIVERHVLNPLTGNVAVEISSGSWHSLAITKPDTIMFECKPGPYQKVTDKDFASWAPDEAAADKQLFIDWYARAEIGSMPPEINN